MQEEHTKKGNLKPPKAQIYDRKRILKNHYSQCDTYNPIAITFNHSLKASSLQEIRVMLVIIILFHRLNLGEIKTPLLRFIFSRDFNSTECELERIRQYAEKKNYENELMLAFWLAIHIENMQIAKFMLKNNPMLKKLVQSACGKLDPKQDIREEDTDNESQNQEKQPSQSKQSISSFIQFFSEKQQDPINSQQQKIDESNYSYHTHSYSTILQPANYNQMTNEQRKKYVEEVKIKMQKELIQQTMSLDINNFVSVKKHIQDVNTSTVRGLHFTSRLNQIDEEGLEDIEFENKEDLKRFKNDLKLRYHQLMSSILKIALSKGEEIISSVISIYYETDVDIEIVKQAISDENFIWIYNLWAFQKNQTGVEMKQNRDVITYNCLFDMIFGAFDPEYAVYKIKEICQWNLVTKNNLLISLINHKMDDLAIEYMGLYKDHVDKDLFIFCLDIGNTDFLQTALTLNAFDSIIFRKNEVMNKIISILREGHRTNFLLNVLCLSEIAIFKIKHIQHLIDVLQDFVKQKYEKNSLLLCSNPMLAICLAAELADKIGNTRKMFANECLMIKDELMKLGNMYTAKIQDEKYYEKLVLDTDITGRSVLKIITSNSLSPLMDEKDAKAGSSMLKLWNGKEAYKCDGYYQDFSSIAYIIFSRSKRIIPKKNWLFNLITNGFEANLKVDYQIQYKYRQKQISFYYIKELICAIMMVVIFQIVNYMYANITNVDLSNTESEFYSRFTPFINQALQNNTNYSFDSQIEGFRQEYQNELIKQNIHSMTNIMIVSIILSSSLICQSILKIIFNLVTTKRRISIDKWTIIDTTCGIINLAAHILILGIHNDKLIDYRSHRIINYFMIFVLVITWARFLILFLMNRAISTIFFIIIGILNETITFLLLSGLYLLIVASIFTALFHDVFPEEYGHLGISYRILFDAILGSYSYDIPGKHQTFVVLLCMHHIFANVILLNYLIAVLTYAYSNLYKAGLFQYKCNLFQYCDRYLVAFEDDAYGQLIVHPPPLNFLSIITLLPMSFSETIAKKSHVCLSYTTFWIENFFMIILNFCLELLMLPLAYFKIIYNFYNTNEDILFLAVCTIMWLVIGPVILLLLICLDCFYLLKILSLHEGCREGLVDELEVETIEVKKKLHLFNETREAIIFLYEKIKQQLEQQINKDQDEKAGVNRGITQSESELFTEYDQDSPQPQNQRFEDIDFYKISDQTDSMLGSLCIVSRQIIIKEWKKRRNQKLKIDNRGSITKIGKHNISPLSTARALLHRQSIGVLPPNVFKSRTMLTNKLIQPPSPMLVQPRKSMIGKQNSIKRKHRTSQILESFLIKQESMYPDDIEIAEEDIKIVDQFLKQFTIVSESSNNDHIDIVLFLKAIPCKITHENIDKIDLFNFKIFQEALIAYQNIFIVNAFEYFDDKNRERTIGLKDKLTKHKSQMNDITNKMEYMMKKLERNEPLLYKISEAVQSSRICKEVQQLAEQNKTDEIYGDKASKMERLVAALQRMANKCKKESETELNVMKKYTLIEVEHMDSYKQE